MNISSKFRGRALLLVVVCFVVVAFMGQRFVSASVGDGQIQQTALRHDTFDSFYRTPFGAVTAGTSVHLRFRTAQADVQSVTLFYYQFDPATGANTPNSPVSLPMTQTGTRFENGVTYDIWELNLTTPSVPAILYYKFRITDAGATVYYSDSYADDNDNLNQGGDGAASASEPFPAFQLTVYNPNFQTPAWLQNANVYQIFPDRFRNADKTNDYCVSGSTVPCPVFYGNQPIIPHTVWNEQIGDPRAPGAFNGTYGTQFYGGDLKGVEQKLDYLQSLGIDTIYLNPIFAARSNHRYDTDDYLHIDPALGGDAAFQ
ncbi:MAG TPA: alpha amylase N-terminal ig-like domain-containing protein, partial [Pyrinomonadaceae bacterium]|nr:alpha amylase N-terminal ig-like domain-containing protein [Pyrinomonadaceae bacterium]